MSKKNKIIPTAIYLRNVGAIEISNSSFLGDARLVDADSVNSISITSNTYMTAEAYKISCKLNETIHLVKNEIPEEIFRELVAIIRRMQENQGKSSFVESYNSFMSSLSNHVTVLTPVMPLIQPLIDALSRLG